MKAYSLDLSPFFIKGQDDEGKEKEQKYPFKHLICNLIMAQEETRGVEIIKRQRLCHRIMDAEDKILLSKEEKDLLVGVFENIPMVRTMTGQSPIIRPGVNDYQAFERVLEGIKEVEVEESKKKEDAGSEAKEAEEGSKET